jgi:hypothetical protein
LSEVNEIADLKAEVKQLGDALAMTGDALFGIAGIVSRVLVDAGQVSREALAEAFEVRAGQSGSDDFNPALLAFARAVRMNFPGGRFEVIDDGRK